MSETEQLLTSDQVQEKLHISRQTLWRWTQEGRLVARRVGRRLLYPAAELDRAMQTTQPAAEYAVTQSSPTPVAPGWFAFMGPAEEAEVAEVLARVLQIAGAPANPAAIQEIVGGRVAADPAFWGYVGRGIRTLLEPAPTPGPDLTAHVDSWLSGDRTTNLWEEPAVEPTTTSAAAPETKRTKRTPR